jgi:hypothetical protein
MELTKKPMTIEEIACSAKYKGPKKEAKKKSGRGITEYLSLKLRLQYCSLFCVN